MNDLIAYSHRLTKIIYTAVALSLILTICAGYFFQKATPQRLFSDYYQHYNRRVVRGTSDFSALKQDYSNSNMNLVTEDFVSGRPLVPEDYLLAGIAFLENKQPQKAIATFKILIQKNKASHSDFFEEDAEYYLAMAYLDNRQPEKAMPIFSKIKADSDNSYHNAVDDWFMLKIRTSIALK